jgi:hypothetical protein
VSDRDSEKEFAVVSLFPSARKIELHRGEIYGAEYLHTTAMDLDKKGAALFLSLSLSLSLSINGVIQQLRSR